MKASSNEYPPKYIDLGKYKQLNYNVEKRVDEDDVEQYVYNIINVEKVNKKNIIKELIREEYDQDDEVAIINNYNENPDKYNDEYSDYQKYRKQCKRIADNIINNLDLYDTDKNIEIIMPEIYVLKSPETGNDLFDEQVYDYRDNLINWGCRIFRDGDNIVCRVSDVVKITVEDFLFITSKDGSNIKYFNPFLKIHEDDIDNKIPDDLPYSDDETKNTWKKWRNENNKLEDPIDSYYYFKSKTFDSYLDADQIKILYNSSDVELVDDKPQD